MICFIILLLAILRVAVSTPVGHNHDYHCHALIVKEIEIIFFLPEKLPANKHFITRPKFWPHSSSSAVQKIPLN